MLLGFYIPLPTWHGAPHTFLRSVITRPTHPKPATSTTFSCQLNSTLVAAPLDSPPALGLPPICEKPVDCESRFERDPPKAARFEVEEVPAMPLYLQSRQHSDSNGNIQEELTGISLRYPEPLNPPRSGKSA
jgi:hypothetical protein